MNVTNELLFRVLFTVLWVIFIGNITRVRYSLREPKSEQPVGQAVKHERELHVVALALFAPFWFGGVILYIFIPSWIMSLSIPLPDWFRMVMAGVTAVGIPFILWAYRTIGKNWVHALDPSRFLQRKEETLVTRGPYRYVRNPIYLGSFAFIVAMALLAANWLLLLPSLVLITIIYLQIPKEELMLTEKFGDEYREYMRRTPRIIPKPRHEHPAQQDRTLTNLTGGLENDGGRTRRHDRLSSAARREQVRTAITVCRNWTVVLDWSAFLRSAPVELVQVAAPAVELRLIPSEPSGEVHPSINVGKTDDRCLFVQGKADSDGDHPGHPESIANPASDSLDNPSVDFFREDQPELDSGRVLVRVGLPQGLVRQQPDVLPCLRHDFLSLGDGLVQMVEDEAP